MPELVTIPSTFRFIISPLMDYILKLEEENPGRKVAVLLPELVVRHWWENAAAQSAGAVAEAAAAAEGKPADCGGEYSLVSVTEGAGDIRLGGCHLG